MSRYRMALEAALDVKNRPDLLKLLADHEQTIRQDADRTLEPLGDATRLARILLDLHRCEHGRLEGDYCLACDGASTGNPLLPPGTAIGYSRYGDPIAVPLMDDHNDPAKWIRKS